MKNIIKNIFLLITASIFIVSCDNKLPEEEYLENRAPYIEFAKNADNFFLKMDQDNSYDVMMRLTAPAPNNMTYSIGVNAASAAVEGVDFSFASTNYSISKGEQFLHFTINGDFDNASVDGKLLKLDISTNDAILGVKNSIDLTLLKYCPIEASFTGSYAITHVSGGLSGFFANTPIWGDGTIVEVEQGEGETDRFFHASYYPALLTSPAQKVDFSLVCGSTIMRYNVSTISCDSGVTPLDVDESTAGVATYDAADDTTFNIIFTENPAEGCGVVPEITEITFTKQ